MFPYCLRGGGLPRTYAQERVGGKTGRNLEFFGGWLGISSLVTMWRPQTRVKPGVGWGHLVSVRKSRSTASARLKRCRGVWQLRHYFRGRFARRFSQVFLSFEGHRPTSVSVGHRTRPPAHSSPQQLAPQHPPLSWSPFASFCALFERCFLV